MAIQQEFLDHLAKGATTVCRCWVVERRDGVTLGFTDHDLDLAFDGATFVADAGLSARALEQSTGLSVDNSEAIGLLSHDAVTEADIFAGRYDGARVDIWLVNWQDPSQRVKLFRGEIGEVEFGGGAFRAELRGLAERLNQVQGRVYQKLCPAILGDAACGFDVSDPNFSVSGVVEAIQGKTSFTFLSLEGFAAGWFERGTFAIESGAAAGLVGVIKNDRIDVNGRHVTLWESIPADIAVGDTVKLIAGCDKRHETCRSKFDNLVNFQGFPAIPGEDWLMSVPRSDGSNTGGSLIS